MFASQWFMTIYAVNIPFECTIRVWDIFFIEGPKILYRTALALLKMAEKKLIKSDIEGLFSNLRNVQNELNPDKMVQEALSFKFSSKLITRLEEEFIDNPDPELSKLCEMY